MISESIELLKIWKQDMSNPELKQIASNNGVLGKATEKRLFDIIEHIFAPRFLINSKKPASYLKRLLENNISQSNLRQIIYLYTCRSQKILYDFQRNIFWKKYFDGHDQITKTDVVRFIDDYIREGKIKQQWSCSSIDRISRSILKTLADFQFIEQSKKQNRKIRTFTIDPYVTKYLAYDIHFNDVNDNSILKHPDWLLFGITEENVIHELERAAHDGSFIVQYSGELLRISWNYKTMEEFIDEQSR